MSQEKRTENNAPTPPTKITLEKLKSSLGLFVYIKPYIWHFIGGLILLSASSIIFMIFPKAAGEMANTANGKANWHFSVQEYGLIFLVILIIQGVISYFRTVLFAVVSERGLANLRQNLYDKILCSPMAIFETRRVGELSSRITADVGTLHEAFTITLAEFIRQIVILIAGVIILFWTTPKLSFIMLVTFPLIVVFAMFFGKYVKKLSKNRQDILAESNIIVDESLQSFHTVKAFNNEKFESNRYKKTLQNLVKISLKLANVKGIFFTFIITILFGGIFFILWQGAILVERGEMQVGDLFSFIIYTGLIGGAIATIGNLYTSLSGAIGATERIQEILAEPSEIELNTKGDEPKTRAKGNIRFENVQFNYPARPELEVLKGINFTVSQGEKIAIVGPSGAGKSTIVQLLMRFYIPNQGAIYLDEKPISQIPISSFRKNFAIVPQEVILFGGTIKENILYGNPDASDEDIKKAAIQANAWQFIQSFPEGLQTIVGERGIKLSGGQRQRIAIARAILRDPAILLLDEATSSLDAESEKLVQEALDGLMKNRTSIIIAHRLATIKEVDRILVLNHGLLEESGTHEELMTNTEGLYHHLANLQFD